MWRPDEGSDEETAGGDGRDGARRIDTPARRRSNEENAAELVLPSAAGAKSQPWGLMNEHPSAQRCSELLIWMSEDHLFQSTPEQTVPLK